MLSEEQTTSAAAPAVGPQLGLLPRLGIATAETLLNDLALYGLNILIINPYFRQDSSFPTNGEAIRRNLHPSSWDWDSDGFWVNQILHPYQGSFNHAAGRANGFGFYESLGFDILGSVVWEIFCETDRPAINDFIGSTIGGASSGEMLHRLYLEVANRHPWLAVPISPVDGLNSAITRRRDPGRGRIQSIDLSLGAEWFNAARYGGEPAARRESWNAVFPTVALNIVYGNPFNAESFIPYEHFELSMQGGFTPQAFSTKVLSDGYLFSFLAIDGPKTQASAGLSLHWDFLFGSNHEFSTHALDWTIKLRHDLPYDIALEFKAHAGWSAFSSDYFFTGAGQAEDWRQNYSTGINGKFFFTLSHPRAGTFSLSAIGHVLFVLPDTIPNSEGHSFIAFFDAAYEFPLTSRLSIAIGDRFDMEYGSYAHVPDVWRRTNQTRMWFTYHF